MTKNKQTGVRVMPCGECGMLVTESQYHPYAACLMFKASHSSAIVEANLAAVVEHGASRRIKKKARK